MYCSNIFFSFLVVLWMNGSLQPRFVITLTSESFKIYEMGKIHNIPVNLDLSMAIKEAGRPTNYQ